jgi:hypothetical protein
LSCVLFLHGHVARDWLDVLIDLERFVPGDVLSGSDAKPLVDGPEDLHDKCVNADDGFAVGISDAIAVFAPPLSLREDNVVRRAFEDAVEVLSEEATKVAVDELPAIFGANARTSDPSSTSGLQHKVCLESISLTTSTAFEYFCNQQFLMTFPRLAILLTDGNRPLWYSFGISAYGFLRYGGCFVDIS